MVGGCNLYAKRRFDRDVTAKLTGTYCEVSSLLIYGQGPILGNPFCASHHESPPARHGIRRAAPKQAALRVSGFFALVGWG